MTNLQYILHLLFLGLASTGIVACLVLAILLACYGSTIYSFGWSAFRGLLEEAAKS